jgi:hypothetical protein
LNHNGKISNRKGISTILGTIIFIGILFTSIIPMYISMNQADTWQQSVVLPSGVFSVNYALGEVETNPKPSQNTGYNQAFYWVVGIFTIIFSLITIIYRRLGTN